MATNPSTSHNDKYDSVEKLLTNQRDELSARISGRLNEVHIDREPDDPVAMATDVAMKDMTVATLDRERRTLEEIQEALSRIKKGEYGICGSCHQPIPEARLKALPWAGFCVRCAERSLPR